MKETLKTPVFFPRAV